MISSITKTTISKQSILQCTIRNIKYNFASDLPIQRVPMVDPQTGKRTDQHIYHYHNLMFSAYLQKRRIRRSQIWPKIHILPEAPPQELPHLQYQQLHPVKRLLDQQFMKKIIAEDPSLVDSTFIISVFNEGYFKELIDQYVGKVLVCGKAPSGETEALMREIEGRVMDLYRVFYFGEKLSPLEREIQVSYLATKQQKYSIYRYEQIVAQKNPKANTRRTNKQKYKHKCTWTDQDQRLVQDYVNWKQQNINLSDLSLRPFYQPLNANIRLPYVQKFHMMIGGDTFLSKWQFNQTTKKQFQYSVRSLQWTTRKLFSRTIQYTKCLQFTQTMQIPPDFTIELLVLNAHIWLLCDRLRQFKTKRSNNLAKMVQEMFLNYINDTLGMLNLKKMVKRIRNYQEIMHVSKNAFNCHFYLYDATNKNPYINIDALIWSAVMKQKPHRYAEEVYLFSQYFIKNRQYLQNYQQQDFFNAICEFDCHLLDPDYKQHILDINPRLSEQEYNAQLQSGNQVKKYSYGMLMGKYDINVQNQFSNIKGDFENLRYSFIGSLANKLVYFVNKYLTNLENYDHYNRMEEQAQLEKKEKLRSPWKGTHERVQEVGKDFDLVEEGRRAVRERNRNKNKAESSNYQYNRREQNQTVQKQEIKPQPTKNQPNQN